MKADPKIQSKNGLKIAKVFIVFTLSLFLAYLNTYIFIQEDITGVYLFIGDFLITLYLISKFIFFTHKEYIKNQKKSFDGLSLYLVLPCILSLVTTIKAWSTSSYLYKNSEEIVGFYTKTLTINHDLNLLAVYSFLALGILLLIMPILMLLFKYTRQRTSQSFAIFKAYVVLLILLFVLQISLKFIILSIGGMLSVPTFG